MNFAKVIVAVCPTSPAFCIYFFVFQNCLLQVSDDVKIWLERRFRSSN